MLVAMSDELSGHKARNNKNPFSLLNILEK